MQSGRHAMAFSKCVRVCLNLAPIIQRVRDGPRSALLCPALACLPRCEECECVMEVADMRARTLTVTNAVTRDKLQSAERRAQQIQPLT